MTESLASRSMRRSLLRWLAASLALPAFARAQPGATHRIGVLSPRRRPDSLVADYYGAFPRRLRELGYDEGRNVVIDWQYAAGDYAKLPALAAGLVERKPSVILALGPPGALAAQKATATIPIVFVVSADPVAAGLVKSLARPGGNITGISNLAGDLTGKHVELLHALLPKLARVGVLLNPANAVHASIEQNVAAAAREARIAAVTAFARTPRDLDHAFTAFARERVQAIVVTLDPFFIQEAGAITSRATKDRLPSVFAFREAVDAGGLMSYGQDQVEIYERAAGYVDQILKGAQPRDMPVQQPTSLVLVINRGTARALGVTIPQAFLLRAHHVVA